MKAAKKALEVLFVVINERAFDGVVCDRFLPIDAFVGVAIHILSNIYVYDIDVLRHQQIGQISVIIGAAHVAVQRPIWVEGTRGNQYDFLDFRRIRIRVKFLNRRVNALLRIDECISISKVREAVAVVADRRKQCLLRVLRHIRCVCRMIQMHKEFVARIRSVRPAIGIRNARAARTLH